MNKVILFVGACILLTGCSHNVINYSDGLGFETTMRPDTGNFGLTFRYGKILSVTARENTEVKMTGNGKANGSLTSSSEAAAHGEVHVKIGKQWNGYLKDSIVSGNLSAELVESYFGVTSDKNTVSAPEPEAKTEPGK